MTFLFSIIFFYGRWRFFFLLQYYCYTNTVFYLFIYTTTAGSIISPLRPTKRLIRYNDSSATPCFVVGVEPQQRQEQSSRNSKQRRFVCSQEVPLVTAAEAALVNWRSLIRRNHQEPSCSCSIYSFAAAVPASITLALAPPLTTSSEAASYILLLFVADAG